MKSTQPTFARGLSILAVLFACQIAYSQDTSAGVNIDNPNPNAVLHLVSPGNDQGLLMPTLSTAQRNAMSLGTADDGLLVYDSDLEAFFLWTDGSGWVQVANTNQALLANILATNSSAGNSQIKDLSDPTDPQDAATKSYVDGQGDSDNQDLDLAGNTLSLTNDGTTVDLSAYLDNTDAQDLANVLGVGNDAGNNTIINVVDPVNPQDVATKNYVDAQGGAGNQDLDLAGNTLSLTGDGTTVDLTPFLDNTDNQDLDLAGNTLSLTGDGTTVDLTPFLDNTDAQGLGNVLGVSNDAGATAIINVVDPTDPQDVATKNYVDSQSDNQDLDLTGNTLSLTNDGTTVDLTPFLDNTDAQGLGNVLGVSNDAGATAIINVVDPTDPQDVATKNYVDSQSDNQDLDLTGNTLSLTNDGTTVDLSIYLDDTDTDNQDLDLAGNTLSLTNDGTTVDLTPYLDNTDAQDLDLAGNTLSLTGDGTTVDLTPFLDNTDAQGLGNVLGVSNDAGATAIINVVDPTDPQDVATKNYVDSQSDNQDLDLTGNTLSLTNDGTTVDLTPYLDNTDAQDLDLAGNTLSLTGDGTTVDLSGFANTDNQDLDLTGNTLSLTNDGTTVDLSIYLDDTDTDNQDLDLAGNILSLTNDGTTVDLTPYLDNTDAQDLDLAGNTLSLTGDGTTVDLSGFANTDNQDLDLTGNTLSLTNDGTTVDLTPYLDNTDAQDLDLAGNTLSLTGDGTTVDLSSFANTDNQDLDLTGNTLSLTNDGTTVDLTPYLDNTDAQDLDLAGNTLSLTGDGTTVDLTNFADQTATEVVSTATANVAALNVQAAIAELDAEKLALAGGTMTGALNMGANNITTTGTVDGRTISTDGTNQDDLQTLSGVAAGNPTLGTFAGITLSDNIAIKPALQELEVAVEGVAGLDLQTAYENSGFIVTDAGNGPFDITGTETIGLAASGSGVFSVEGGDLDLQTSTGGDINISPVGSINMATSGVPTNVFGTLNVAEQTNLNADVNLGISNTDVINVNGDLNVFGDVLGANPMSFQGLTDNANVTTLSITDPTAINTITFPDASGTVLLAGGLTNNLALSSNGTGQIVTADDAQPYNINSNTINLGNGAGDMVVVAGSFNATSNNAGNLFTVTNTNTSAGNAASFTANGTTPAIQVNHGSPAQPGLSSNNGVVIGNLTSDIAGAIRYTGTGFEGNIDGTPAGWQDMLNVAFPLFENQDNAGDLLNITNTNVGTGTAASFTASGTVPAVFINHGSPAQPGLSSNNGVVIGNLTSDIAGAIRYTGTGFEGNIDGTPAGWQDMLNVAFPLFENQDNAGDLLNITNTNVGTGTAASFTASGTVPAVFINHGSPAQPGLSSNNGVVIGNLTSDIAGAIRYTGTGFEGNIDGTPAGWQDMLNVAFPLFENQDNTGDLLNITNMNTSTGTAASFTASGTVPAVFINHGSPAQPGLSSNNGVVIGNLTSDIAGAIRYTGTGFEGNIDGTPAGWQDMLNVAFPLFENQDNAGDLLNITNMNTSTGTAASFTASGTVPAVFINHGSPAQPGLSSNNGVVIGNLTSDIAGAIRYTGTGFEGNIDGTPAGWQDMLNITFPVITTQDNLGLLLDITNTNATAGAAYITSNGTVPVLQVEHTPGNQPSISTNTGIIIGDLTTTNDAGSIRFDGTDFEGNIDGTAGGWRDMLNITFPVITTQDNLGLLLDITNTNATAGAAYITSNGTVPVLQVEHTPGNQPSISTNTGIIIGDLTTTNDAGSIRFDGTDFEGNIDGTAGGWRDLVAIDFEIDLNENGFSANTATRPTGFNNVSIGLDASATVLGGDDNVLIGRDTDVSDGSSGGNVAIGFGASTNGGDGVAVGSGADAGAIRAVAIGSNSQALAADAVAVGAGTIANSPNTMVLGDGINSDFNVGIGVQSPQAPLQVGDHLGFAHFENLTETVNGELIANNIFPDYTNATDNELRRMNANASSLMFMDDGNISFIRAIAGAANSVIDLNADTDNWLSLNDDGSIDMETFDARLVGNNGADMNLRAGDAFTPGGTGNGGNIFLSPGVDGGGGGAPGQIIVEGELAITGDGTNARFLYLDDGNSLESLGIRSPDALTSSYEIVLPDDQGTGALFNDGSGFLSWSAISGDFFIDGPDNNYIGGNAGLTLSTGNTLNNILIGDDAGQGINTLGSDNIMIGNASSTNDSNFNIAIGDQADASGDRSVSIGLQSASDVAGVAIGAFTIANVGNSIAIGGGSTPATGAVSSDLGGIAIGFDSEVGAGAGDAISIGSQATNNSLFGIALGLNSTVSGTSGSIALGANTTITGAIDAIALGSGASNAADGSIAIGAGTTASALNAVAIGLGTEADTPNTIILGDGLGSFNVGVGVRNPSGKLGINQTAAAEGVEIIHNAASGSGLRIDMSNTSTSAGMAILNSSGNSIETDGDIELGAGNLTLFSAGGILASGQINADAATITTSAYEINGTPVITNTREVRPNNLNVNAGAFTVTATGNMNVTGRGTISGAFVTPPAPTTSGTLTVTTRVIPINADVVDINTGLEGQEVILIATAPGINVLNGGTVLLNGGADFNMTINSTLHLIHYNGAWLEVSRNLQP